jgi:hypothetical protein
MKMKDLWFVVIAAAVALAALLGSQGSDPKAGTAELLSADDPAHVVVGPTAQGH